MLFHTIPLILLGILMPAAQVKLVGDRAVSYRCAATTRPIVIDGKLDDPAWADAPWTSNFVNIRGAQQPAPPFRTRAKLLWDRSDLYVAIDCQEPDVHATIKQHDAPLYKENAVELFLDPGQDGLDYIELEINAIGTTYDTRLDKPYSAGGRADDAFELEGLRAKVHVEGTINQPGDEDHGWSAEIAIPWSALKPIAPDGVPPRAGTRWGAEMARAEHAHESRRATYSCWSPIGKMNLHVPEQWGTVQFAGPAPAKP
jgi:hypothetical protein